MAKERGLGAIELEGLLTTGADLGSMAGVALPGVVVEEVESARTVVSMRLTGGLEIDPYEVADSGRTTSSIISSCGSEGAGLDTGAIGPVEALLCGDRWMRISKAGVAGSLACDT